LEVGAPDDATATRIQSDLKAFEDWLAIDKILAKFQSDIVPRMRSLESEIASGQIQIPEAARQTIDEVGKAFQEALAKPLQNATEMNDVYRQYARLRALWDVLKDDGLDDPLLANHDLMKMLSALDALGWRHLTK